MLYSITLDFFMTISLEARLAVDPYLQLWASPVLSPEFCSSPKALAFRHCLSSDMSALLNWFRLHALYASAHMLTPLTGHSKKAPPPAWTTPTSAMARGTITIVSNAKLREPKGAPRRKTTAASSCPFWGAHMAPPC